MTTPLLLYKITLWVNSVALVTFLAIEIFWHVKEKRRGLGNILSLAGGFLFYNIPFLLLAISMSLQSVPENWTGLLRLIFLGICIPINLWLHYHGDKGGNSIGMAIVFFLVAAVPLILIIEIFIALY